MKQTQQRIYNRALYYLQRFSATEKHLAEILARQLKNKQRKGEEIPPEAFSWIAPTVEKIVALGLVNDQSFAESRLETLRRQGRSSGYIKQHLAQKGVPKDIINHLLQDATTEDDYSAALRMIDRKRLGKLKTPEATQKDLAKLVRSGFNFSLAQRALKESHSHDITE